MSRPHWLMQPVIGHVTSQGWWHAGVEHNCGKCHPPCSECRRPTNHHKLDCSQRRSG